MKKRIISLISTMAMAVSLLPVNIASASAGDLQDMGTKYVLNVTPPEDQSESAFDIINTARWKIDQYWSADKPVEVVFAEGTYRFNSSISLPLDRGRDNGTATAPITYKAADGAKVVFKNSTVVKKEGYQSTVTDFDILKRLHGPARDKVVQIDLAAQGITSDMLGSIGTLSDGIQPVELFVNDERQTLAQWPNGDNEYSTFSSISTTTGTDADGNTVRGTSTITVSDTRLMRWEEGVAAGEDIILAGFISNDWLYETSVISAIDSGKKTITLETPSIYDIGDDESKRYKVMNAIEELDVPGEYYIDRENAKLYYYPKEGYEDATLELTLSDQEMIVITGADYLTFDGITFAQTRGSGVRINLNKDTTAGADNLSFIKCTFENIAKHGIFMYDDYSSWTVNRESDGQFHDHGAVNMKITGNTFRNIGDMAMDLIFGNRTTLEGSGNVVSNNHIYNVNSLNKKSYAINVEGTGATISNNTIHHAAYGIRYSTNDVNINNNEIYNVLGHINDGAAIYAGRNFVNRGNKIFENYIHDTASKSSNMNGNLRFGIYLDDMEAGNEICRNIIDADGSRAGVYINSGMANYVYDNTVVNYNGTYGYISTAGAAVTSADGRERYAELKAQYEDAPEIYKTKYTIANGYKTNIADDYAKLTDSYKAIVNNVWDKNVVYSAASTATDVEIYNEGIADWLGIADTYVKNNNTINAPIAVAASAFNNADSGDYRLTEAQGEEEDPSKALTISDLELRDIGSTIAADADSVELKFPQNGETAGLNGTVTLLWERPNGGDKFRLAVSENADMSNPTYYETYITRYQVSGLISGKTYYWRVDAKNDSVNSVGEYWSSAVNSFTVAENQTDLETILKEAEALLDDEVEGTEVGDFKTGAENSFGALVDYAYEVLDDESSTEYEKLMVAADVEHAINSGAFRVIPEITQIDLSKTPDTFVGVNGTITLDPGLTTVTDELMAEITWTSSNEAIATVENGVVTGIAQGVAAITASAENGLYTDTVLVIVTADSVGKESFDTETSTKARTGEGAREYVTTTSGKFYDSGEKDVISFWFYDDLSATTGSIGTDFFNILHWTNVAEKKLYFYHMLTGNNLHGLTINSDNGTGVTEASVTRTEGWHQAVIVDCGKTFEYYIDGVKAYTGTKNESNAALKIKEIQWVKGDAGTGNMWIDDVAYADFIEPEIEVIDLSKTANTTVGIGGELTITATVNEDAAEKIDTIAWTSSNEAIATVANGVVTGKAQGVATITATAGDVSAKILVIVTDDTATALAMGGTADTTYQRASGTTYAVGAGEKYITETVTLADNQAMQFWFYDSDVTKEPIIRFYGNMGTDLNGESKGNYWLQGKTDYYNGYYYIQQDVYKSNQVAKVTEGWHQVTLVRSGNTTSLYVDAEVLYTFTGETISMTVLDYDATSLGTETGYFADAIHVDIVKEAKIDLSKTADTVVGTGGQITITADTNSELEWTSSNEAIATVANGVVTGVAQGVATITATAGDVSASVLVIVTDAEATKESFDTETSTKVRTGAGAKEYLQGNRGTFYNSVEKDVISFWFYDDLTANMGSTSGDFFDFLHWTEESTQRLYFYDMFAANNAHILQINGRDGTGVTEASVTRTEGWHQAAFVDCGKTFEYYLDGVKVYTGTKNDTNATMRVKQVDWETGNGNMWIDDIVAVNLETVLPEIESIDLSKTANTLVGIGGELTITATVNEDAAGIVDTIAWTSSNEAIATVANGVVTGKAQGVATITATAGDVSASVLVIVTDAEATALAMGGTADTTYLRASGTTYAVGVEQAYITETVTLADNQAMQFWFYDSDVTKSPIIRLYGKMGTDLLGNEKGNYWLMGSTSQGDYYYIDQDRTNSSQVAKVAEGWHQVTLVRSGNTTNLYVDGAVLYTFTGETFTLTTLDYDATKLGTETGYFADAQFINLTTTAPVTTIVESAIAANSVDVSAPVIVSAADEAWLLVAQYDATGRLLDVNMTKQNVTAGLNNITSTVAVLSATSKVKAMIWNDDLMPYREAVDYEIPEKLDLSSTPDTFVKPNGTITLVADTNLAASDIVWTSSNEAIATVANGVVTGVAQGVATITATSGEHEDKVLVIVAGNDATAMGVGSLTSTDAMDRVTGGSYAVPEGNYTWISKSWTNQDVMQVWFYDSMAPGFDGSTVEGGIISITDETNQNPGYFKMMNESITWASNKYVWSAGGDVVMSGRSEGWHQLVAVSENGVVKVYIDGEVCGDKTLTGKVYYLGAWGFSAENPLYIDDATSVLFAE